MNLDEITKRRPGDLCLVCGGPATLAAIFRPEDSSAWGASAGRSRLFRYCLCSKCQGRQNTPDRVEKILRVMLDSGEVPYRGEIHVQ